MSEFFWSMLVIGAVALVLLAALGVVFLQLKAQIALLAARTIELERRFDDLQQQNQRDLLAMGQRVMEADKLVQHFNARLDSVENSPGAETQYGQLESLLTRALGPDSEASAAEVELLSLLRRQQQR